MAPAACAGPGQCAAVQPELVGARQQRELRVGRECQWWWLDGGAQRRCEQLWRQPWQGLLWVSGEGLQFRRMQPVFGSRDGGGGAAAGGDEPLSGGVADATQAAVSGPVLRRMEWVFPVVGRTAGHPRCTELGLSHERTLFAVESSGTRAGGAGGLFGAGGCPGGCRVHPHRCTGITGGDHRCQWPGDRAHGV
ncbi:hypothetical protein G6F32_013840 [Rhizopus arrhizus]|nr:hypothetical protein G6F32_013840 [Rhizopus arrhizus]